MIYFTSDTFFGRSSKAKSRDFSSVEEMNLEMINLWNATVKPNDIVYHLGNFAWDIITAEQMLLNLNGVINFMPSSYDSALLALEDNFSNIEILETGIKCIESRNLVLSPWRMVTWPAKSSGSIHLHGGDRRHKSDLTKENRFNTNCELWSLSPVSLDSLTEVIKMVKENKE
jgi:calcineurin-like phosphoesterase family protein